MVGVPEALWPDVVAMVDAQDRRQFAVDGATNSDAQATLVAEQITLPNPAAQFCVEQGGDYDIREGDKGMVGVCVMPDGTELDAWSYYRESRRLD